jgi:hypothetical protein
MHKVIQGALTGALLLVLAGCEARSISNSGYQQPYAYNAYGNNGDNPFYQGELSAYEVLGGDARTGVSDGDIQRVLAAKQPMRLKSGAPVMLVQSGAVFADPEMIQAMGAHYQVSSFTGVPPREDRARAANEPPPVPYSQLFRLAAAKGGFDTIIVYWGVLESAVEGLATKGVSWVPVVGGVIPDETQRMRIRLVAAIIDVRSGQWETVVPEPVEDEAISNEHDREASDQDQVQKLKEKGYRAMADAISGKYGG